MKSSPEPDPLAERPALDFSTGVRGKHLRQVQQGTNLIVLDPDLLQTFPDSTSVNEALRSIKQIVDRMKVAS